MRILFISDSLRRGGKERQLTELIKHLIRKDHNVLLILFNKNIGYSEISDLNIEIKIFKKNRLHFILAAFQLISLIKLYKPQIIHSWSPITTLLIWPGSKIYNIPVIDSIRYAKKIRVFSKTWLVSKFSFAISKMVIANSKAGLRTHHKLENGKYRVIYNGFDFKRNDSKEAANDIRVILNLKQKRVIGMVANFQPGKDYYSFAMGAKKLLIKFGNLAFVCIGDGPDKKNIEEMIPSEYRENFYFTGKRTDVEEIVKIFDIGVLLSNTNVSAEGISNALIEIMSAGIPVIATNAGGNPELIGNNKEGFLIEPFDIEAFVERTETLLTDENLRLRMGEQAREKIRKTFSVESMVENYLESYRQLIK
jgi:glycosyltransferase involved in cell wall biosynthesis